MPQLDSLLRIVHAQGANELRLGSDKTPTIFSAGEPRRLTVPATSTQTLVELLGELFDDPRQAQLDKLGRVELSHDAKELGQWRITVTKRPGAERAFDVLVNLVVATKPAAGSQAHASGPSPVAAGPGQPSGLESPFMRRPEGVLAASANRAEPPTSRHPYRASGALSELLVRAVRIGASDLHLAEGEVPTVRVDGKLRALQQEAPPQLFEALSAFVRPETLEDLGTLPSVDFSLDVEAGVRARVNVYRCAGGLAAAVRLLPPELRTASELGYPVPIDDLALLESGLVLVTGATGSGKSTTLAALAAEALGRRSIVLLTLEDPIEHLLSAKSGSLVRQRQVGRDVDSFERGLRDALREDPDVLLIGEMRDAESISLALTAAETGHLVLASMHARSAAAAVERILDAVPPTRTAQLRGQLADSLRAVLSQRLLTHASGTGRVLAAEVLRSTPAVASAIRDGKISALKSAMQSGRQEGMIPLERCLADLVKRRSILLSDAQAIATDVDALAQYLSH